MNTRNSSDSKQQEELAEKKQAEGIREARKEINKIIARIEKQEKLDGSSFIFRGESKIYKTVPSGLYRHYCMPREEDEQVAESQENTLLIKPEYFSTLEMAEMIIDSAREHFEEGKSAIGILTGLQHQGGKTVLIDFTRSVYIALYFACNNHLNEGGRILMIEEDKTKNLGEKELSEIFENLHTSNHHKDFIKMYEESSKEESGENLESVSKEKFDSHDGDESKSKIYRVNPIGKEPRVVFQSSVFVFPVRGFLKEEELCVIEIKKDLKKDILKCLSKYHGIEEKTIYNDLQGFIQRSPSEQYTYFYQAMIFNKEGKYEDAIEKYNKVIEINSKSFEAYRERGIAKFALGERDRFQRHYEDSITDYDKSLKFNPEDAYLYYNRGNSKFALGMYHKSQLGMHHESQRYYKEAIKDYDQSLKFDPEYIFTYSNRGIANDKCGNYPEAIEDFEQALRLLRKQESEEMEKMFENIIRMLEDKLNNPPANQ